MLTITPIAAVYGLVSFDPSNWGGEPTLIGIIGMAMFGLITVQVWITYIPSLILTPIIMRKLSDKEIFYTMPIWKFFGISILVGIVAGIFILLPCILLSVHESLKLILNWTWAGVVAGSVTFPIIASIYRFTKSPFSQGVTA
jgi:hypothetical protein